jgi:Zn-dependent protease
MDRRPSGAIALMRVHQVPVYLHWSFPAGAFFPLAFAHFELVPSLYLCTGYVLLVLLHELGHLAAARLVKHHVLSIEISGDGGRCTTEAPRSLRAAACIFSGGLVAQFLLLLAGVAGFLFLGDLHSEAFSYFLIVSTIMNVLMFIANIIPSAGRQNIPASDGHQLWKLLQRYLRERR